jgi:hypothetical protein
LLSPDWPSTTGHRCPNGVAPGAKPALGQAVQQHLRDGQADHLGVGERRAAARSAPDGQEIVDHHIKCGEQGVEAGEHEATSVVDVALANADLRRPRYVPWPRIARRDSESLI